jgi:hypothetical protein
MYRICDIYAQILSLSLSLYIYIYVCVCVCVHIYLLIVKMYLLLSFETSRIFHLTLRTIPDEMIFISNAVTQILNSKHKFFSSYG